MERTHQGSCHCGAVRFEAKIDLEKGASRCNCSICTKVHQTGFMLKPDAFKLVSGKEELGEYAWGAKMSTRSFCKRCGVHCFGSGHLAELGGDFVSVNIQCLDGVELRDVSIGFWDGRHNNWQAGTRDTPWPIT